MEYDKVLDSGKRKEYSTGAVRDTAAGKGRYDLLPPYAIHRLAQHYANGSRKYADRNWERGIPTSRFMDSALRHLFQYLDGDRSEDHMAAAAWNALGLIWTEEEIRQGRLPKELDTLPQPMIPTTVNNTDRPGSVIRAGIQGEPDLVKVRQDNTGGDWFIVDSLGDRLNQLSEADLDFLAETGDRLERGGILCPEPNCYSECERFKSLGRQVCQ